MESAGSSPNTQELRQIFRERAGEGFHDSDIITSASSINENNRTFFDGEGASQGSIAQLIGNDTTHTEVSQPSVVGLVERRVEASSNGTQPEPQSKLVLERIAGGKLTHHLLIESKSAILLEKATTDHEEESHQRGASEPAQPSPPEIPTLLHLGAVNILSEIEAAKEDRLKTSPGPQLTISSSALKPVSSTKKAKMEHLYSPIHGSDGSYQSTTQENDPATYSRHRADAPRSQPQFDSLAVHAPREYTQGGSTKTADTGHSFNASETSHLNLDYSMPLEHEQGPLNDEDDDDDHAGYEKPVHEDVQQQDERHIEHESQGVDPSPRHHFFGNPRTPASKAIFRNPGTVMGPSQLFAATQPSSTGYRGPHGEDLTSSRPSPDLYGNQRIATHATSSPLLRRIGDYAPPMSEPSNVISSPFHSTHGNGVNENDGGFFSPSDKRTPLVIPQTEPPFMVTSLPRNVPEPHDRYISRRESHERRLRVTALNDESDSSEDEFSDLEATRNRIAKARREEAARVLANVRASRPGSSGSDLVEVPSTSNGRRCSLQDDYLAQYTEHDAREIQENVPCQSQLDVTIADSQVLLAPAASATEGNIGLAYNSLSDHHVLASSIQSAPILSTGVDGADSPPLILSFDAAAASDSSITDDEAPDSPLKAPTQALSEVSGNGNRNEICPSSAPKSLLLSGDEGLVPETSPPEAHQRRYVGFEKDSQPIASCDGRDEIFNPFSQDVEYEAVVKTPSPSPGKPKRRLKGRRKTTGQAGTETKSKSSVLGVTEGVAPETNVSLSGDGSSEYATAPNTFATAGTSLPKRHEPLKEKEAEGSTTNDAEEHAMENTVAVVQQLHKLRTRGEMRGPSRLLRTPSAKATKIGLNGSNSANDKTTERSRGPEHNLRSNEGSKGDAEDHVMTENEPGQPQTLRTRKEGKRPSSLQRGSVKAPRTASQKVAQSQPGLLSTTRLATRLSTRTFIDYTPSPALSSSSKRAAIGAKPSPAIKPSSKRASIDSKPSSALRSSSRRTSIDPLENVINAEPEPPKTPKASRRVKSATTGAFEGGLFHNMAFSVSYGTREDEKLRVVRFIEQHGGRILEKGFDELFYASEATSPRKDDRECNAAEGTLIINADARDITFTCLLADQHTRKAKYMQALALGLPCISGLWIEHCVRQDNILDWGPYMLAAGESTFLGGAIRSRSLVPYPAETASFEDTFASRELLLAGKSILLVMGKARKDEDRKKAYLFLTQLLGAKRIMRVVSNQEVRKVLLEAESNDEMWDCVYIDVKEEDANNVIFGAGRTATNRKRKRASDVEGLDDEPPKKIRLISDEFIVQSLILGKLLEKW